MFYHTESICCDEDENTSLRMTNITKGIKDVNGKRTDNTIAKRKNYERQTMVYGAFSI
jgi:hypothetical protein